MYPSLTEGESVEIYEDLTMARRQTAALLVGVLGVFGFFTAVRGDDGSLYNHVPLNQFFAKPAPKPSLLKRFMARLSFTVGEEKKEEPKALVSDQSKNLVHALPGQSTGVFRQRSGQ